VLEFARGRLECVESAIVQGCPQSRTSCPALPVDPLQYGIEVVDGQVTAGELIVDLPS
jgi:hypothetical protein